tara:strand:- start:9843 stop:11612 length:1770 start_codon:yes stop_codon:yes gene_type:complete
MDLKEIKGKNLIIADDFDILTENKVDFKSNYVVTFLPNKSKNNLNINFYSLIDQNLHKHFENNLETIIKDFYNSLDLNLALKKNITRLVYGQIGLFPFFHLINNLIINNNKLIVYTKEKKILKIFQYFEGNSNLKIFFIDNLNKNYSKYFKISKFEIFKLLNFNEIIFILKKKFFTPFKKFKNLKKNVFIHLSTEPNFRILDIFLNKNWQSKILEINTSQKDIIETNINNQNQVSNLLNTTNSFVKKFFYNNQYFLNFINEENKNFLLNYIYNYNKISNIFGNLNSNFFFLIKIIRGPLATALYDYGKKNKKNFKWICHQHGHGIELTDIHKKSEISKEETLADLFFIYSNEGEKERLRNKYINPNIKFSKIGYWTNTTVLRKIPNHDIIYISNLNQELGPHEINMSSLNNTQKINFETELISKVFAKCKHKILFKDYPGNKSTNLKYDFIGKISKNYKNIIYFNEWLNAENIYNKSSIIITSLPTSGITAAINSNKPLIYINIEKLIPLKEEVKNSFKRYFFYFEYNENLNSELSKFLAKDLHQIRMLWKNKITDEKKIFIKKYFNIQPQKNVIKKMKEEISDLIIEN